MENNSLPYRNVARWAKPFALAVRLILLSRHAILQFYTTRYCQFGFYHPLCYNSRAQCPLRQCLRIANAIIAGTDSYFVVSSFKREGKISCHDLIPIPRVNVCWFSCIDVHKALRVSNILILCNVPENFNTNQNLKFSQWKYFSSYLRVLHTDTYRCYILNFFSRSSICSSVLKCFYILAL